ncbi:MAG: photosynthetic complex putative assembly protein PuhB [Pseudomonadota bacterium]
MPHDDFQFEPTPGLPSHLPEGEGILWQGRPAIYAFARDVLKLHWVAGYFLFLIVWRGVSNSDQGLASMLQSTLPLILFGAVLCAVVYGLSVILATTTIYTITNKRVVIRKGASLEFSLNLPFKKIISADVAKRADGSGTIALTMSDPIGLSYLMMWPHVRPWKMKQVAPSLRSIKDVSAVSDILAEAAMPFMVKAADASAQPERSEPTDMFPAE